MTMTMTLYHGEPNGPSLTVLAALFEKEVVADLVAIDLSKGERHNLPFASDPELAMSVEGEGPVLVVDGEAMTDSVFIACYLDEIGNGPALRPADPYARWECMMWCRRIIERCAPAAAFLGCKSNPPMASAAALASVASADLRARWDAIEEGVFDDDHVADSETKIRQVCDQVEEKLQGREWLMGPFSIADLETYGWLAGMRRILPDAFAEKPALAAWLERVRARPSVARALSLALGADPQASWAPGPEINRWG
jgi:GSH-dependent disulfide-bond oxidoreductase